MKSVIIKNQSNSGNKIVNAEVDEESLNFINGIAVAKVKILYTSGYECHKFCIINENYEEAFTYDGENDSTKILSLSNNNTNIERITENDFVVTSICSKGSHCTRKNCHIKIEDNIPKLIHTKFYNIKTTKCPNIIIVDGRLYNVKIGNFITRKYYCIEEILNDKQEHNKFFVTDKLEIDNNFADYLSFVIDENDHIISPIYFEVELGLYIEEISNLEYEKIKEKRLLELHKKRNKSNEIIKMLKKQM